MVRRTSRIAIHDAHDPFFIEHGRWTLPGPCPKCGATDGWKCYPGDYPTCWRCGVIVMLHGRTPQAKCVTPNGRIDSHLEYGAVGPDGRFVCAFCGER